MKFAGCFNSIKTFHMSKDQGYFNVSYYDPFMKIITCFCIPGVHICPFPALKGVKPLYNCSKYIANQTGGWRDVIYMFVSLRE